MRVRLPVILWYCDRNLYACSWFFVKGKKTFVSARDVTSHDSHRDLWEGNGNSHSNNSDTVMGMWREPGIFLRKNNCRRQPAIFFWESLASRRKCLRGCLTHLYGCGLPKTSVLEIDNSNYYVLEPPLMYFDTDNNFILSQKVFLLVIGNIKEYKRNIWIVTMWPVCKYLYYMYIHI